MPMLLASLKLKSYKKCVLYRFRKVKNRVVLRKWMKNTKIARRNKDNILTYTFTVYKLQITGNMQHSYSL